MGSILGSPYFGKLPSVAKKIRVVLGKTSILFSVSRKSMEPLKSAKP